MKKLSSEWHLVLKILKYHLHYVNNLYVILFSGSIFSCRLFKNLKYWNALDFLGKKSDFSGKKHVKTIFRQKAC